MARWQHARLRIPTPISVSSTIFGLAQPTFTASGYKREFYSEAEAFAMLEADGWEIVSHSTDRDSNWIYETYILIREMSDTEKNLAVLPVAPQQQEGGMLKPPPPQHRSQPKPVAKELTTEDKLIQKEFKWVLLISSIVPFFTLLAMVTMFSVAQNDVLLVSLACLIGCASGACTIYIKLRSVKGILSGLFVGFLGGFIGFLLLALFYNPL